MNIKGCALSNCEGRMHTATCSYNAERNKPQNAGAELQKPPTENQLAEGKTVDKLFISQEARQALAQVKDSSEAEKSDANLNAAEGHELDDDDHMHGEHSDEHHDDDDDHEFGTSKKNKELSREEQQQVRELQVRDRQVRAHEQAHVAASGRIAVSAPQYELERGPDGRQYAVGGSVNYNMPASRSPEDKLLLAQQLRRMAMAPMDPSPKDRATASKASSKEARARQEMREEEAEALNETSKNEPEALIDSAEPANSSENTAGHQDDAAAGLIQALLFKA